MSKKREYGECDECSSKKPRNGSLIEEGSMGYVVADENGKKGDYLGNTEDCTYVVSRLVNESSIAVYCGNRDARWGEEYVVPMDRFRTVSELGYPQEHVIMDVRGQTKTEKNETSCKLVSISVSAIVQEEQKRGAFMLLLDISSSMVNHMETLKAVVSNLIEKSHPCDFVGVVLFDTNYYPLQKGKNGECITFPPPMTPTNKEQQHGSSTSLSSCMLPMTDANKRWLLKQVKRIQPRGATDIGTPLLGALAAMSELHTRTYASNGVLPCIVCVTDGESDVGPYKGPKGKAMLEMQVTENRPVWNIPLHVVGLGDGAPPDHLKSLADPGHFFYIDDTEELIGKALADTLSGIFRGRRATVAENMTLDILVDGDSIIGHRSPICLNHIQVGETKTLLVQLALGAGTTGSVEFYAGPFCSIGGNTPSSYVSSSTWRTGEFPKSVEVRLSDGKHHCLSKTLDLTSLPKVDAVVTDQYFLERSNRMKKYILETTKVTDPVTWQSFHDFIDAWESYVTDKTLVTEMREDANEIMKSSDLVTRNLHQSKCAQYTVQRTYIEGKHGRFTNKHNGKTKQQNTAPQDSLIDQVAEFVHTKLPKLLESSRMPYKMGSADFREQRQNIEMLTTEVMSLDDKVRIENAEDLKHSQDILALRDAKYGYSLLSLAAGMWDEPTVIRLVAKGHDLLAQNHDGDTPLHIAVRRDFHDVVRYMLELKRPELLLAKNNKGQRPLDCANEKGFMREMIMRSSVRKM